MDIEQRYVFRITACTQTLWFVCFILNRERELPVIVYYYGGAFVIGMAEMYPGESLALHGDVIVVNFNFRVSIMGFLSTGKCKSHSINVDEAAVNQKKSYFYVGLFYSVLIKRPILYGVNAHAP